jgi:trans-AT polyketide synthase, acyltransferase and oxidoreductase domains
VRQLRDRGEITSGQAAQAAGRPVADDLCVEAGSGWLADTASLTALLPAVIRLRDSLAAPEVVHVGAAGGLGTPEAVAAAFFLGADFVLTGSVNQCTVQAATSAAVKDMLQRLTVDDLDFAPCAQSFELGMTAQVMKRGVFFPARAALLRELWHQHEAFAGISPQIRAQVEGKLLQRPFAEACADVIARLRQAAPDEAARAASDPKRQMALVFRSYLDDCLRYAREGDQARRVDYLVYCGPAMGAFNSWAEGTDLEPWQARHADVVANRLMTSASLLLAERCARLAAPAQPAPASPADPAEVLPTAIVPAAPMPAGYVA